MNYYVTHHHLIFNRQTITASAPILTIIVCGMTTGYSSVLLPQLQNDSSLSIDPLTKNELSWIASIAVRTV